MIWSELDIELVDFFLEESSDTPVLDRNLIDSVTRLTSDQVEAPKQFIKSMIDKTATSSIRVVKDNEFDFMPTMRIALDIPADSCR